MTQIRLHFSPLPETALVNRDGLSELARPFFGTESRDSRIARYPDLWAKFDPDAPLADADIAVLGMDWRYYLKTGRTDEATAFVQRAADAGKPCAIFCMGDRKAHIRTAPARVFGSSLYRSRSTLDHPQFAVPSMFPDLLPSDEAFTVRHKQPRPLIGFCGQGTLPPEKLIGVWVRNTIDKVGETLFRVNYEKPPIRPHILLRGAALAAAQACPNVNTNFIIREVYLGHLGNRQHDADAQRQEFLANIRDSDYTLCIRGGGNFSKRLYEVLCMGRIPVFIDTDCILPFDFNVDWKQYAVWVEAHEIDRIGEKVAAFHDALSDADFVELQHACRAFWRSHLTFEGFLGRFGEHFVL